MLKKKGRKRRWVDEWWRGGKDKSGWHIKELSLTKGIDMWCHIVAVHWWAGQECKKREISKRSRKVIQKRKVWGYTYITTNGQANLFFNYLCGPVKNCMIGWFLDEQLSWRPSLHWILTFLAGSSLELCKWEKDKRRMLTWTAAAKIKDDHETKHKLFLLFTHFYASDAPLHIL